MTELNSPRLGKKNAAPKSTVSLAASEFPLREDPQCPLEEAERHALIARLAYLRAERRGFVPGHELEDWLAAEQEFIGQPD